MDQSIVHRVKRPALFDFGERRGKHVDTEDRVEQHSRRKQRAVATAPTGRVVRLADGSHGARMDNNSAAHAQA